MKHFSSGRTLKTTPPDGKVLLRDSRYLAYLTLFEAGLNTNAQLWRPGILEKQQAMDLLLSGRYHSDIRGGAGPFLNDGVRALINGGED